MDDKKTQYGLFGVSVEIKAYLTLWKHGLSLNFCGRFHSSLRSSGLTLVLTNLLSQNRYIALPSSYSHVAIEWFSKNLNFFIGTLDCIPADYFSCYSFPEIQKHNKKIKNNRKVKFIYKDRHGTSSQVSLF